MNDLQQLLKLRGVSMRQLADELGHNMHSVQKTVKGTRANPQIRTAIAAHLGLPLDESFGPSARRTLRKLIRQEIVKRREAFEQDLTRKTLGTPTLASGQQGVNV